MATKVRRAGLIPYVEEEGEVIIMLMKPSNPKYGGGDFQVAKGKVDPGENDKEAAIREASEELGLIEDNIENVKKLGVFLGYTTIFYGKIKDKKQFTDTTYETGETTWMSTDEFIKTGRRLHVPIIKSFVRALAKG